MTKIAVILSGCGFYDGAEIHESVLTMLCIERSGASYQCFAPDIDQFHVVDHLSAEESTGEKRNVLTEAARIARGNIKDLTELNVGEFDAIAIPGGFGVAKNLANFAIVGEGYECNQTLVEKCKEFVAAKKPLALACIAPILLPHIIDDSVSLTIGNDVDTAAVLANLGATHVDCQVNQVALDKKYNVVTTPAYMLATNISECFESIEAMINQLMEMV